MQSQKKTFLTARFSTRQISDGVRTSQHCQICDKRAKNSSCKTNANERNHLFFLTYLQRKALLTNYMDIFQIINTVSRSSRHFADHLDTFRIILILPDRLDTYQIISIDKPARLSFTCSLDLLLISIKQI